MNTSKNTEKLFDIMESGRLFNQLSEAEKELVLTEFETIESYNSMLEFNSKSKRSLKGIESSVHVNSNVKQDLLSKFRERNDQKNVKQGSVIAFTPTFLGLIKLGAAASLLLGIMVLPKETTVGGEVLVADTTTVGIDTSFSSIDTSSMIRDTITFR